MKTSAKKLRLSLFTLATLLLLLAHSGVQAAGDQAADSQASWYHTIVGYDFISKYAVIPLAADAVIIDSRPTARKYDMGHIPGAISIPDLLFDTMTDQLPEDKNIQLIFYCGGVKCFKSHQSAFKAEKLGYTNISVYAEGYPEWVKKGGLRAVSPAGVKKMLEGDNNAVLVDSRPKKRKYDKGHIPSAISIPDREFDKYADLLPEGKDTQIIFYCGGYKCTLSGNSAHKAIALGYTNVKTFPAGFPAWKEIGGSVEKGGEPAANVAIKAGKEDGTISIDSFDTIVKENPDSVHIIDVRSAEEFSKGSIPTAINMPIDALVKDIDGLPADKPIIYICGSGTQSGEAHDITAMMRDGLKTYFLNAQLAMNMDGTYTVTPIVE